MPPIPEPDAQGCRQLGSGHNARLLQPLGGRTVLAHYAPPRLPGLAAAAGGNVSGGGGAAAARAQRCMGAVAAQVAGVLGAAAPWEDPSAPMSIRQHVVLSELARAAAVAPLADGGAGAGGRRAHYSWLHWQQTTAARACAPVGRPPALAAPLTGWLLALLAAGGVAAVAWFALGVCAPPGQAWLAGRVPMLAMVSYQALKRKSSGTAGHAGSQVE